ncbi:rhodanese-like domain-containing protein [Jiulongibacter sediminis]|uniref:Thioredoxin n=1 Tax=Jiulongibacter sediminis TaxID=1605367 RepID=A0A0P7C574_9BACT|nr:rhodanese-like domain-containing protein [Jiulongibacter sediminis]KPM49914.1 hypothetical protein AFM12_04925 [Jiulongibacter sediminis]TBX26950.1 hypothetical protein TK44_04930 [Jiulongibacter sediminis]
MKSLKSFLFLFVLIQVIAFRAKAQDLYGLSPDLFQQSLRNSTDPQLIDLREEEEFRKAHIRNAQFIDYAQKDFKNMVTTKLQKTEPVYLYCFTGTVAKNAMLYLKDLGFQEVYYLYGGLTGWISQSKPYVSQIQSTKPIAALTNQDLDKIISRNQNVFIFLSAPWCKYCKIMEPIVKKNTGDLYDIKLVKIDGSKELSIAERFHLTDTPTFVYFQNGKQVWRYSGQISEDKLQDVLFR